MVVGILDDPRISCSPINDDVIVLSINTDKYNSLCIQDIKSMILLLESAEQDNRIKMLIISGSGTCFCTGLDVEHLLVSDKNGVIETLYFLELLLYRILVSPILIVSAINGHTIGGGAVMAVATDYRIALNDQRIKIGFPEYKKGIFLPKLMRTIISQRTKVDTKMLLFGEYVGVGEAMQKGIIDECKYNDLIDQAILKFINIDKQTARTYKSNFISPVSELLPYRSNAEYEELCNRILGDGLH